MFITRQIIEDPERNMIGEIINPPMATHQKPASLNDLRGVSYISGADRTGKRAINRVIGEGADALSVAAKFFLSLLPYHTVTRKRTISHG